MATERHSLQGKLRSAFIWLLAVGWLALGSPPALAADGLDVGSETTYRLMPEDGVVRVEAEYTIKNTTPDRVSGYRRTQYFYEGIEIPIPSTATNVRAESAGRELTIDLEDFEMYPSVDITFRKKLWYRQSQVVLLTYDLPSEPPRSDALVRVNPAYAAFPAFGVGDAGAVTVRVVVPDDFTVDMFGADIDRGKGEDGLAVYIATDIPTPDEWFLFITARRDEGLESTTATAGNDVAVIRSWPDDPRWASFVKSQFTDRVPIMEELIGIEWPLDENLEVIETISPNLYGAAGWFILDENLIEVDESLDSHVMLHEFAHAWFHHESYEHRWLSEGLAEEFAYRTIKEIGGALKRPEKIDRSAEEAIPLNRWDLYAGAREPGDEREAYGYAASWHVIREITNTIGMDGLQSVLAAIAQNEPAYLGEGQPTYSGDAEPGAVNWRRFLDLVEERGETEIIDDVFLEYVVADVDKGLLADRDVTRLEYQALQDHGGTWTTPVGVRELMEGWDFAEAQTLIAASESVLERRDQLAGEAAALGVTPHPRLERMFEDAVNLAGPSAEVDDQLASVRSVAEASAALAADRDIWTRIGLLGTHLEVEYDAIKASYEAGLTEVAVAAVTAVQTTLDEAGDLGRERSLKAGAGATGVLLIITLVVFRTVRGRRRRKFLASLAGLVVEADPSLMPRLDDVDDHLVKAGTAAAGDPAMHGLGEGPTPPPPFSTLP